ncbi:hypothetical protein [Sporocytophaga myxococcoides]|uniref:hypothetical protein n=1 Tax=Sporocytophaga myxococcoides TaxID=153721 RepID=UPI00048FB04A|nr:hypothetical protein [Sporocytophaga myxococcoides]
MKRLIYLSFTVLLISCNKLSEKIRTNYDEIETDQCSDWSKDCHKKYIELDFKKKAQLNKKTLIPVVEKMYDTTMTDEQFLDRFLVLYKGLGLLPLGRYEICDSCWINTITNNQKISYKNMIVGVYLEYLKSNENYPNDTLLKYSNFVNEKHRIQLDSGLYSPAQYMDTLNYFIKNKIEVDLGG